MTTNRLYNVYQSVIVILECIFMGGVGKICFGLTELNALNNLISLLKGANVTRGVLECEVECGNQWLSPTL